MPDYRHPDADILVARLERDVDFVLDVIDLLNHSTTLGRVKAPQLAQMADQLRNIFVETFLGFYQRPANEIWFLAEIQDDQCAQLTHEGRVISLDPFSVYLVSISIAIRDVKKCFSQYENSIYLQGLQETVSYLMEINRDQLDMVNLESLIENPLH